jgi:hypothetical protein
MSLSDFSSVGNIIGAFAVVISLIYLGMQIRQNTRHAQAVIQQSRSSLLCEHSLRIADSHALDAFMRGMAGDTNLTLVEQAQFIFMCRSMFFISEDHFLQNRVGLLTKDAWVTFVSTVRSAMGSCGYRAAWRANRPLFSVEFRNFMDEMMRATPADALGPVRLGDVFQSALVEEIAAMRISESGKPSAVS